MIQKFCHLNFDVQGQSLPHAVLIHARIALVLSPNHTQFNLCKYLRVWTFIPILQTRVSSLLELGILTWSQNEMCVVHAQFTYMNM